MRGGLERERCGERKEGRVCYAKMYVWNEDRSRTGLYLLEYIAVYLDSLYIYVHKPLTKSKTALAVLLPELMMWVGAVCV